MSASHDRHGVRRKRTFTFNKGDLVLVKWTDGMVYFAKIKHIYHRREKCVVVFDDKSQDEADFSQIHSVDETTTDIICIKCKRDDSDSPNEIVLCDKCGIGFHQKCHNPPIPVRALKLDSPWNCSYCQHGTKCPFLTESLDVLQNLLSDDNESANGDDEVNGMESEGDDLLRDDSSFNSGVIRKRKGHRTSELRNHVNDRRMSLRNSIPAQPEVSSLVTVERKVSSGFHSEGPETDSPNSKDRSMSEDEDSGVLESPTPSRKRKKFTTPYQKRLKRFSVESHTVSVTRLDSPVFSDGSSDNKEKDDNDSSLISSPPGSKPEKRSLRVSLSLPDEVERRPSLKSPLSCNGSPSRWDALSPNSKDVKDFPSIKEDCIILDRQKQHNPAPFLASPLPTLVSKHVEMKVPPINTTSVDMGVSETLMQSSDVATNSVVISSSKIPAAKHPAKLVVPDESICLTSSAVPLTNDTADSDVTKDSVAAGASAAKTAPLKEIPNSCAPVVSDADSVMEEKTTESARRSDMDIDADVGSVTTAISCDKTTIANPTTLPVVIERSLYFQGGNGDSITPTTSSPTVACSTGVVTDTSCIISKADSESGVVGNKTTKLAHSVVMTAKKHEDVQPHDIEPVKETDFNKQYDPVSAALTQQLSVNSLVTTQSSGDEERVVTLKTRPSNLFAENTVSKSFLNNDLEPLPAALTSVITSKKASKPQTHSPDQLVQEPSKKASKPQTHSPDQLVQEPGEMSQLDSELASVVGHGESIDDVGHSSKTSSSKQESADIAPQVVGQASSDVTMASTVITARLVSEAVELATKKTAQDAEKAEKASSTASARITDLDVIITAVEPSKETTTRRDSPQSRPNPRSDRTREHASVLASSGHLNRATGGPAVQATATTSVDQRVKSPPLAGSSHMLYSDGSRVPFSFHSSPKSVVHTPNGPALYYAPVHPDVLSNQGGGGAYPTSVTTSKPFAIVNALPVSSSEAPVAISQKVGEGSRQQLVEVEVYRDGNGLSHIIPVSMLPQQQGYLSPDSTAGAEPMAASFPTIVSATDEKGKTVGKKIRPEDLQSIHKKIGDAFNTSNVSMLMSAFNEAWDKFQANGTKYQNQQVTFNNVSFGIANQPVDGNLVSTRPRVVAPKLSSIPVATGTPSASSPQYIHAAKVPAGSQKQQQYILQPITSNSSYAALYAAIPTSSHQLPTTATAAAYPTTSSPALRIQSEQTGSIVTAKTPPVLGSNKGPVADQQHGVKQNQVAIPAHEKPYGYRQPQQARFASRPTTTTKPGSLPINTRKPVKSCAKCRKGATFLCSGCHHEWYCGRDCQLKDWDRHAENCKA